MGTTPNTMVPSTRDLQPLRNDKALVSGMLSAFIHHAQAQGSRRYYLVDHAPEHFFTLAGEDLRNDFDFATECAQAGPSNAIEIFLNAANLLRDNREFAETCIRLHYVCYPLLRIYLSFLVTTIFSLEHSFFHRPL